MALHRTGAVEKWQVPDRPNDAQKQAGQAPTPTRLQGRKAYPSQPISSPSVPPAKQISKKFAAGIPTRRAG
ncbi:MAG: hypothetical protein ABIZ64_14100 [Casimicrobium sp.]